MTRTNQDKNQYYLLIRRCRGLIVSIVTVAGITAVPITNHINIFNRWNVPVQSDFHVERPRVQSYDTGHVYQWPDTCQGETE